MGAMQGISVINFVIDVFSCNNDIVFVVMVVGVCFSVALVRQNIITNVVTTTTLKRKQHMFLRTWTIRSFQKRVGTKGEIIFGVLSYNPSKNRYYFPMARFWFIKNGQLIKINYAIQCYRFLCLSRPWMVQGLTLFSVLETKHYLFIDCVNVQRVDCYDDTHQNQYICVLWFIN